MKETKRMSLDEYLASSSAALEQAEAAAKQIGILAAALYQGLIENDIPENVAIELCKRLIDNSMSKPRLP